jgi:hypothetical protein
MMVLVITIGNLGYGEGKNDDLLSWVERRGLERKEWYFMRI